MYDKYNQFFLFFIILTKNTSNKASICYKKRSEKQIPILYLLEI